MLDSASSASASASTPTENKSLHDQIHHYLLLARHQSTQAHASTSVVASDLRRLLLRTDQLGLISLNETLEDVPTRDLLYFSLSYHSFL